MSARVDDDELRTLVETSPTKAVAHFIDDAHVLVDETLVGISPPYTDARLKLIEKYLAAHLFVLSEERGGLTRVKKGESEDEYQAIKGMGLQATRFGQMVLASDPSGKLALLDSGKKKAQLRLV